jgi:hypothetical protein
VTWRWPALLCSGRARHGQGTLLPRRARSTCRAINQEDLSLDPHASGVDCRNRLRLACPWQHAKRLTLPLPVLQSP